MLQGTPHRRDIDAACAAFGIDAGRVEGPPAQDLELQLWPDNQTPAALFIAMAGQWRMAAGGPFALDYAALPVAAQMLRVKPRALRRAFAGLRVMEAEALAWFGEQTQ